ncbi:MAG: hypothetical protein HLUCCA05_03395 [Roseibaca calidilacus]|uniref:Uncharacterized protein n=1 Tax=Roseibaca calidilacus TaxID=1666912 RepID=A0A0P7WNZ2_9RHOB|nr:hypothetical protein [Roseibaca calidilacus]KPP95725.1 MAG: hypothetical protein HLUCCA05_03395 [Roseibaca calidilacus]CUX81814.1 hypothetical protein Ga0058931_1995 [Roseibaca calidilacus]
MFDDTNLNGLYGDPTVAHNAMIAALAAKALGKICNDSAKCCERERVTRSAARKANRIVQRCKITRS